MKWDGGSFGLSWNLDELLVDVKFDDISAEAVFFFCFCFIRLFIFSSSRIVPYVSIPRLHYGTYVVRPKTDCTYTLSRKGHER